MKDHLIFDVSDANTILDSDSVGAFVRANDGTLITKHSIAESIQASLISQGLIFKSKLFGAIGNTYSFTVVDVGVGLSYTEIAGAVVVDLGGTTPTRAAVVALLAGSAFVDVSTGTPTGNVIAASILALSGGEDTNFHKHLDVYAAMADGNGNAITSVGGSLNVNVTNTVPVSATNLDIRDLDYTRDNLVIAGTTGNMMVVNADGSINANVDVSVTNGSDKLEDVAHTTGDVGTYVLAVRQDTLLASTSNDGDYASFKVDALGALYTNISNTVTTSDAALADTAIIAKTRTLPVVNVGAVAVTAALAARKYLSIYNMDNNKIFIGGAGVVAGDGFPLSPGSYMELRAGVASAVYFVGSTGKTPEIRTLELS